MNSDKIMTDLFNNTNGQMTIQYLGNNESQECSEDDLINSFKKIFKMKYKVNIENWIPNQKEYPHYMFLGGDRGILAYLVFKVINTSEVFNTSLITSDLLYVKEVVSKAFSDLDRPVFFIYLINTLDKKTIYFETDEQIKDRLFNDENSYTKDKNTYIPNINTLGTLNNLIESFKKLKNSTDKKRHDN